MTLESDGSVYASRPSAGLVVRLRDLNHDGVADEITTVKNNLNGPHGLAFRGDTLYVAETNEVIRLVPPAMASQIVVPTVPTGGHTSRTILFRGDTLFLSVGSSCNVCLESDPRRAAITAYRADGSGEQVYATGLRNSVGLAVNPGTNEIWATNNDRDYLGDDLPPDRVNILQQSGFYGWPQCYLPGKANPEFAADASRCGAAIGPAAELPAHVAPLGLAFYQGSAFPRVYHGALFVAEHGSWNRSTPIGYQVVWIPTAGGRPSGAPRVFVSGWLEGSSFWGRPVDLLPISDGSLLISDDQGGRIYRVSYQGG
jgi:glucose/arabinose dehydrogenase